MKSFLICHRGALGDFILTWPSIYCLRKALPQHKFIGIGRTGYMRLAVSFGILDTYIDNESAGLLDFFCGKSIPEQIGSPHGAVIWLTEGQKIIDLLKQSATLPVISIPPFPDNRIHLAQYYCSVIKSHFSITVPENLSDIFPSVVTERQYALIHPGSGSFKKNFSPLFYRNLADELRRSYHHKVGFIFGPVEDEKMNKDSFAGEWIEHPSDVEALAKLLAGATVFIGNDSGVSHLSGFLGTKTIAFYKATDPKIWGVIGKNVSHISAVNEGLALREIRKYLIDLINYY